MDLSVLVLRQVMASCLTIHCTFIAYLMKDALDEVAYHITSVLDLPRELRISTIIGYLHKLKSLLAQPRFARNNTAAELTFQISDFTSSSPLGMDETEPR